MGTPVPTLTQVIDVVAAQMTGITPSIGTVRKFDHQFEGEVEDLLKLQAANGNVDAWYIDEESEDPLHGPAAGEKYRLYNIRIRGYNLRVGAADWVKQARDVAKKVIDKLNGNTAVFAIGGQPQLRTPDVVAAAEEGKTEVADPLRGGAQTFYLTVIRFTVEARDWS